MWARTYTRKSLAAAVTPRINELALLEPTRRDAPPNLDQPFLIPDPELGHEPLGTHARSREMAQHRPRDVALVLPAGSHLDGPVAMPLAGLRGDDLVAVELEDGARGAETRGRVVERRHAVFYRERAGAKGKSVGDETAVEGCGFGGGEGRMRRIMVEAVGPRPLDGFDAADRGEEDCRRLCS